MVQTASLQIPIKLVLAQSENVSSAPVKPVYLLASRQCYLPALAEQALRSFEHVLLKTPGQGADHTPWFEYRGAPLHWTLPCGILFDLIAPPGGPPAPAAASSSVPAAGDAAAAPSNLPWVLTVHYRDLPASLMPSWCSAGSVRDQYFNSLKEALYVCRGAEGANAVMRMSPAAQDELWRCVAGGRGPEAAPGWAGLRAAPSARQGSVPFLPVRILVVKVDDDDGRPGWERAYSTSRPVEALQPDGSPTTVAHALHKVVPGLFPAPPPVTAPALSSSSSAAAAGAAAAAAVTAVAAAAPAATAPPGGGASAAEATVAAAESGGDADERGGRGAGAGAQLHAEPVYVPQAATSSSAAHSASPSAAPTAAPSAAAPATAAPAAAASAAGAAVDDLGPLGSAHAAAPVEGSGGVGGDDAVRRELAAAGSGEGPAAGMTPAGAAAAGSAPASHNQQQQEGDAKAAGSAAGAGGTEGSEDHQGSSAAGRSSSSRGGHGGQSAAAGSQSGSSSGGQGGQSASSGGQSAAAGGQSAQAACAGSSSGDAGGGISTGGAQQKAAATAEALAAAKLGPHPGRAQVQAWAESGAGRCKVVVSGVAPPLHTPLAWLHARLHAADYFLYLVVHMPSRQE